MFKSRQRASVPISLLNMWNSFFFSFTTSPFPISHSLPAPPCFFFILLLRLPGCSLSPKGWLWELPRTPAASWLADRMSITATETTGPRGRARRYLPRRSARTDLWWVPISAASATCWRSWHRTTPDLSLSLPSTLVPRMPCAVTEASFSHVALKSTRTLTQIGSYASCQRKHVHGIFCIDYFHLRYLENLSAIEAVSSDRLLKRLTCLSSHGEIKGTMCELIRRADVQRSAGWAACTLRCSTASFQFSQGPPASVPVLPPYLSIQSQPATHTHTCVVSPEGKHNHENHLSAVVHKTNCEPFFLFHPLPDKKLLKLNTSLLVLGFLSPQLNYGLRLWSHYWRVT